MTFDNTSKFVKTYSKGSHKLWLGSKYPLPTDGARWCWSCIGESVSVYDDEGRPMAIVDGVLFPDRIAQTLDNYNLYKSEDYVTHALDAQYYICCECSLEIAVDHWKGHLKFILLRVEKGEFFLTPPWLEKSKDIEYRPYLQTPKWKSIRQSVLDRDKHLCICGDTATVVHHKTYKNCGHEELGDLVSVCRRCHTHIHKYLFRKFPC